MKTFTFTPQPVWMARLERGDDLLQALQGLVAELDMRAGAIHGIGAVERAVIGYYDQQAGRYLDRSLDGGLEITSLLANVSLKGGAPFVHCHLTLADREGHCHGGHLMPGTRVFACELWLQPLGGDPLRRVPDAATGLALW